MDKDDFVEHKYVDNDINVFPLTREEVLIKFMDLSDTISLELRKQVRQGRINTNSGKITRSLFRQVAKLAEQYRWFSRT